MEKPFEFGMEALASVCEEDMLSSSSIESRQTPTSPLTHYEKEREPTAEQVAKIMKKYENIDVKVLYEQKPKRKRASTFQVTVLSEIFKTTQFPSTELRALLAKELSMSPRTIQIWFQNKRQTWKSTLALQQLRSASRSPREMVERPKSAPHPYFGSELIDRPGSTPAQHLPSLRHVFANNIFPSNTVQNAYNGHNARNLNNLNNPNNWNNAHFNNGSYSNTLGSLPERVGSPLKFPFAPQLNQFNTHETSLLGQKENVESFRPYRSDSSFDSIRQTSYNSSFDPTYFRSGSYNPTRNSQVGSFDRPMAPPVYPPIYHPAPQTVLKDILNRAPRESHELEQRR